MFRIGHGYDFHKFGEGRNLIIGGVKIEHPVGLLGHSDADVLLHAISDACLGGLALGDIGKHFPDTDPDYKDADSRKLLCQVSELMQQKDFKVINVDATVVADQPKLAPYIESMRRNIADDLNVDFSVVSVKATTKEGCQPEGMSAHAVVLLQRVG